MWQHTSQIKSIKCYLKKKIVFDTIISSPTKLVSFIYTLWQPMSVWYLNVCNSNINFSTIYINFSTININFSTTNSFHWIWITILQVLYKLPPMHWGFIHFDMPSYYKVWEKPSHIFKSSHLTQWKCVYHKVSTQS